jgi:hypothetical protein
MKNRKSKCLNLTELTISNLKCHIIYFIAFNCHKFSFFSFVNCLLTALKQKIAVALDHTFKVTFLEKFVKTVKSKCEIIFNRFGSFGDNNIWKTI